MAYGFIWWIVVGLIAGWAAGRIMKGGGYGMIADILLGIVGGIVGGWVVGLFGLGPGGFIWTILVAILGAVILIWITRLIKREV
ncbi:MAG TPA: GlsB/YeaQ/YmgE family stress response membrane protein [Terriglobales bacterium]|nr:GlsB/YeaQ/YmgE family stress response membrane protein [Terriglobales bacterium]